MKRSADLDPPKSVLAFLKKGKRFFIFGHREPDADCVSAQLALASFLERMGKEVQLYSEGPFDRPEIAGYRDRFRSEIRSADLEGDPGAIVLDCSTAERIGTMGEALEELAILVVDHHAAGEVFGDVRWVDPRSPSVTYQIQRLVEACGEEPTAEEAQLMLFGLARDTGFFRHLVERSGFVFQAVARLVDYGASPRSAYWMIHSGWELAKARLLALSIQRVESLFEGRVLLTYQSLQDLHQVGSQAARGSDEVYRILQAVQGVEVVAFIQEERKGSCSVGLRSNGSCDVGTLSQSMGGGGHTLAAGYTMRGGITLARERLLAALEPLLRA